MTPSSQISLGASVLLSPPKCSARRFASSPTRRAAAAPASVAAGSVPPQEAFRYAFESGADYICAGMYDFQMVEDANIALETLVTTQQRPRRWSV